MAGCADRLGRALAVAAVRGFLRFLGRPELVPCERGVSTRGRSSVRSEHLLCKQGVVGSSPTVSTGPLVHVSWSQACDGPLTDPLKLSNRATSRPHCASIAHDQRPNRFVRVLPDPLSEDWILFDPCLLARRLLMPVHRHLPRGTDIRAR